MFVEILIKLGVLVVLGVVMIYVGVIVLDLLFYGFFFYVIGGVVNMVIKDCMKLISYEVLIGLISIIVVVVYYCFFG